MRNNTIRRDPLTEEELKDFERRIKCEAMAASPLTEDDMICKDCRHKLYFEIHGRKFYKNGVCAMYEDKPIDIILRHASCGYYEKERP